MYRFKTLLVRDITCYLRRFLFTVYYCCSRRSLVHVAGWTRVAVDTTGTAVLGGRVIRARHVASFVSASRFNVSCCWNCIFELSDVSAVFRNRRSHRPVLDVFFRQSRLIPQPVYMLISMIECKAICIRQNCLNVLIITVYFVSLIVITIIIIIISVYCMSTYAT